MIDAEKKLFEAACAYKNGMQPGQIGASLGMTDDEVERAINHYDLAAGGGTYEPRIDSPATFAEKVTRGRMIGLADAIRTSLDVDEYIEPEWIGELTQLNKELMLAHGATAEPVDAPA